MVDKDGKVVILNAPNISPSVLNYQGSLWSTDNPESSETVIEEWGSNSIEGAEGDENKVVFTYDGITYTLDFFNETLTPNVTEIYPD